jgi:hypothetical protein
LGERVVRNDEVVSSILIFSTKLQRLTALSWAFLFLECDNGAAFRSFCVCRHGADFGHFSAQFDSLLLAFSKGFGKLRPKSLDRRPLNSDGCAWVEWKGFPYEVVWRSTELTPETV